MAEFDSPPGNGHGGGAGGGLTSGGSGSWSDGNGLGERGGRSGSGSSRSGSGEGGGGGRRRPRHASARPWWSNQWVLTAAAAIVVVAVVAAIVVCSSGKGSAGRNAPPPAPGTTAAVMAAATCPLTGMPAPGGVVPERPALAIKVDNYPAARPQSGLADADLVFEEPVEGGITRYVAVYQCQEASLVGPIRSARYPDVGILSQLGRPIFVHVGGITPILDMITSAPVIDLDLYYNATIVQNPPDRVAPYDTYASTSDAWAQYPADKSPPAPIFSYSSQPAAGSAVTSVHIPFSPTSDETWTWNPTSRTWLLSYSGVPDDDIDGNQLSATNVVVERVDTYNGPYVENSLGAYEVEFNPLAGGSATVYRNGIAISGTWKRSSLTSPTQLVGTNGAAIALAPGNTWVELVPTTVSITTASPTAPTTAP